MRFAAIVALALLFSLTNALWYHSTAILVEDRDHRPIPHAKVIATWQLSEYDQQHEMTGYTDYMGMYQLNMSNYVQLASKVRYKVTVRAEYGAGSLLRTNEDTLDVRGHADPFAISLPLNRVKINLFTKYGWPVDDASVYIAPWTFETDSSGSASFILPNTKVSLLAELGDVRNQDTITVDGDGEFNITMDLYRLTFHVVDQAGKPRSATTVLKNVTYSTDPNGVMTFNPFPGRFVNLSFRSGDIEQTVTLEVKENEERWVVFDVAAPQINETARTTIKDEKKMVVVKVGDAGKYASGLDSVIMFWYVNGQEQEPIEMYPQDSLTFAATLPAQPPNTTVSYVITARDKQGNFISTFVETYSIPPVEVPDTNQTGGGWSIGFIDLGGINWWLVIGGIAVLIVIVVVYIYWKGD